MLPRRVMETTNWSLCIIGLPILCLKHRLHTYIIDHYNPSVRIIDLASDTTYVVCVNFIHKWGTCSFFEKLFHGNFFYSQSFCQKSTERKSSKKYFSYYVLMSGLGLETWRYVKWVNALPTRLRRLLYYRLAVLKYMD